MKWLLPLIIATAMFASPLKAEDELPYFEIEGNFRPHLVDRMHTGLERTLDSYASYFDNFFGDERANEEAADTEIRLIGSFDYHEISGFEFTPRIKARINLPRAERRLNLLIDTESNDTSSLEDLTPPGSGQDITRKDETTVALQLVQKSTTRLGINHRVGVSVTDGELNPKAKSQVRFTWEMSERDLLRFTQSVFWENVDGFGQESRFDFEHLLHRGQPDTSSLFRATIRGLYSETSDGYEWSLPVEVFNALPNQRAYSYGGGISGVTDSDDGITNAWIFYRYRQSIWRDWLFFDVTPWVEWPKSTGRNTITLVNFSLEMVF